MWRTAVITFAGMALIACGGGIAPPAPPTATPTVAPKADRSVPCGEDAPEATLSFDGERQSNARVSINWEGDDCAVTGHPFFTLPLPSSTLTIPLGERAELKFSVVPDWLSAYAWSPAFEEAEVSGSGKTEVPLDDRRGSTRVDLALDPLVVQQLPLDLLPPGEYAIEVYAGWHRGSSGFAFRVEIVELIAP